MKPAAETGDTERLEQEAEVEKQRLLHTLDELVLRKHRVDGAVAMVRHGALARAVMGGALVALAAICIRHFARRKRSNMLVARFEAAKRMWTHPERVAH